MRLTLRISLKIKIKQGDGNFQTIDARTTVVNKNGARAESEQAPPAGQEVRITVPASGQSSPARVTWVGSRKNENGCFEFGVELDQAENLWGVTFPPSDWK